MPNRKDHEGQARQAVGSRAAMTLTAELRQPLTAAMNYIGVARAILCSSESQQMDVAIATLDKGCEQILRAGEIVGQIRHHLGEDMPDWAEGPF